VALSSSPSVFSPSRLLVSVTRVGGARGGLASRGVAPTVLSGAALGHDRVRDGTGWGQHALGHGHPPPPSRKARSPCSGLRRAGRQLSGSWQAATQRHTSHGEPAPRSCPLARAPCPAPSRFCVSVAQARPGEGMAPPSGARRPTVGSRRRWDRSQDLRPRPLGRLGSSRLPAVHLPPINPVICRGSYLRKSGDARLGEGFPLRCFQRFARPHVATQRCRSRDNWHTSGASTPVLSY
jgi:hypothetical protein